MSSVGTTLLAVSLLMDLESRGKNERVGRVKRKRMVPKFKVLGQLLISRVQFNDLSCHMLACKHAIMQTSCKHVILYIIRTSSSVRVIWCLIRLSRTLGSTILQNIKNVVIGITSCITVSNSKFIGLSFPEQFFLLTCTIFSVEGGLLSSFKMKRKNIL